MIFLVLSKTMKQTDGKKIKVFRIKVLYQHSSDESTKSKQTSKQSKQKNKANEQLVTKNLLGKLCKTSLHIV